MMITERGVFLFFWLNLKLRIRSIDSSLNTKIWPSHERVMDHKIAVRIMYSITDGLTRDSVDFIVSEDTTLVVTDDTGTESMVSLGEVLAERY